MAKMFGKVGGLVKTQLVRNRLSGQGRMGQQALGFQCQALRDARFSAQTKHSHAQAAEASFPDAKRVGIVLHLVLT